MITERGVTATGIDAATAGVKILPHSIEAEQALLGGLLLDNQAWDKVADKISPKDFYQQEHRFIFSAIMELAHQDKPFDPITLTTQLKANNVIEKAGSEYYLYELSKNTPSAANLSAYADIVRERSILRQLITTAGDIADIAYFPQGRISNDLLDEAERRVFEIAEQGARGTGPVKISHYITDAIDRVDKLYKSEEPLTGLATGYYDLDELTSGLQPADLVVVAGRPSSGKTCLAINISEYAAINGDLPVLVFSMEMPGQALALRMLSSLGRIDQHRLRTGKLTDDDWPKIASAVSLLSKARIFIDDTPALSPSDLRARARRLAREQGQLGLIVVDYLQLMQLPGFKENRTMEISEISRSLKSLAKELNVPVIAISQLNRGLESRTDKRPMMSDLRESGAIEQDADVIAFIYRDEVYHPDTRDKGIAEIIIGKQRNGPIGVVKLAFLGQYTRFENLSREYYQQNQAHHASAGTQA